MLQKPLPQLLLFLFRYVSTVMICLAMVPIGIFVLLNKLFPMLTDGVGLLFWLAFSLLTLFGLVLLWRPILWITGVLTILTAGHY